MFDVLLGLVAGLSGLVPFLHVNLLLSLFDFSSALFVAALGFSHLVFSFVPSVFFGLPGEASGVAALPSHEFALRGEGLKALRLLCLSFFFGLLGSIVLFPLFLWVLPLLSVALKPVLGFVLLVVVLVFFFVHGFSFFSLLVFALSGLLGVAVFSFPIVGEPLFPLLAGLFGLPGLLYSFGSVKALSCEEGFAFVDFRLVLAGVLLGGFSVLLPALSPAFLAAFAFLFLESSPQAFLVLVGSLASSKAFFDLASVFVLHKARSGFAAFFLNSSTSLVTVLAGGVLAACVAVLVVLFFGRRLAFFFSDRVKLAFFVVVVLGVFVVSGFVGLFVLCVATLVGLLPLLFNVARGNCVGALILPALLYAFGFGL